MKKRILSIAGVSAFSALIVIMLFLLLPDEHRNGGFKRSWKKPLTVERIISLRYNGYYIAGVSGDQLYLGHKNVPLQLLKIASDSILPLQFYSMFPPEHTRLRVVGNQVFCTSRNPPLLLQGNLDDDTLHTQLPASSGLEDLEFVSSTRWVIRETDLRASTNTLITKRMVAGSEPGPRYILPKQVDGIFCTDGMLMASPTRIVYTYYYRNEVLVFDTALQLIQRFHTLDTMRRASIQLAHSTTRGVRQLATPPPFVNRKAAFAGDYIFIHSPVQASNEQASQHNSNAIDVYKVMDGRYVGSFYLADYKGKRLKEFVVCDSTLYALHGEYLIVYTMVFMD